MENNILRNAIETSLINAELESNSSVQHKLLRNKKQDKIITTLINELGNCDEFIISVAFITYSGVNMLLKVLKELEDMNITTGKILTGDYLLFTEPKAVRELSSFNNIEVKLITEKNFHAKGYFFRKSNTWKMIIGSSNLTSAALTKTSEWNIMLSTMKQGAFTSEVLKEFKSLWEETDILSNTLPSYEIRYLANKETISLKNQFFKEYELNAAVEDIKPNMMQKEALLNLQSLRDNSKNKGLIVSATGTGKTFLSAFDVKQFEAKRCLFIVHRRTIAQKSLDTFAKVFPNEKLGLLSGTKKQLNANYIFATVQTLANNLDSMSIEMFDYIIIDEVHHGGAKTYQKIFNYFKPKFWLGMTATPERTDGFNIFEIFDYNIAYEYRLPQALEDELLVPFHYFGISEVEVDGEIIDENTAVNKLTSDDRVNHIVEKIKYYGYSGDKVHGLIFVSNVQEAVELSLKLNQRGLRTKPLSGSDSEAEREEAIEKLESGELEYIITVDIFNEGVDIPSVNQIVMLRPTSSAIVYVQQMGRGLRKSSEKEFVVIIDFIGNYKNNYLIPIAVGNEHTYNKDTLKKNIIINGTDYLEGESVIQFEEVVKEKLLSQITNTNFSTLANIKRDFEYLKLKLGRTPKLSEFITNELISPEVILAKRNYIELCTKFCDEKYQLTYEQKLYSDYIYQVMFPMKRVHEIEILYYTIEHKHFTISEITQYIEQKYNVRNQKDIVENSCAHLSRQIFKSLSQEKKYASFIDESTDGLYTINERFSDVLKDEWFKLFAEDALLACKMYYMQGRYDIDKKLTVGKNYTRLEAYKYTLNEFSNGHQVSGYTVFESEVIVLITLDNSSSFTSYDNELIDCQHLTWFSKGKRKIYRDGKLTAEGRIAHNELPLEIFVKKSSSEEFYYLGTVNEVINYEQTLTSKSEDVVKYTLKLDNAIDQKLFDYLKYKEN